MIVYLLFFPQDILFSDDAAPVPDPSEKFEELLMR